ncbi:MAG: DUF1273 domain-containing protein [Ruminococcus sp.]|nr:DUF1273 domain-containing protein [Ruminococcus sp.]MCM1381007.1 DUF1273 domain-containing protein [Muribaculaceae bacterium]MCM1479236.1 DUF1273 domain-containing protein [Muribaculaceae bacterium]
MIRKHKAVCFTGHRNSPHTPEMRFYIKNLLDGLIVLDGADTFYAGGSKVWDNDCSDIVLEMQKEYPHIKLCLVLPYPEKFQTDGLTDSEKEQYRRIVSQASSIELCSENRTPNSEKIRNARLVELADCCVCYLNQKRQRSGTYQTYKIAQKKGIEIYNLYDDEVIGKAVSAMLEEQGRELEKKYKDYPDIQPPNKNFG